MSPRLAAPSTMAMPKNSNPFRRSGTPCAGKGEQEREPDDEARQGDEEGDQGREADESAQDRDAQRPRHVRGTSRKGGAGRESLRRKAPGTNHAHRSVPLLHVSTPPREGIGRRP